LKAIICTKYGPPEVLQLKDVEKPTPKDNEVLIKVHATTVTSGDVWIRGFIFPLWFRLPGRIMYGFRRPRKQIPGNELSGVIESVGKNVIRFKPGDQVLGISWGTSFQGTTAEYKCLPETAMIVKKPEGISFVDAAAIPVGGITALYFMRKADIKKGQKILIFGASGSVGTYAVQIAKLLGAEVTGVCSTANLDLARSLGANHVVDYRKEDFTKNGKIYDFIFDAVRKTSYSECKNSLRSKGTFLTLDWPLLDALLVNLFSKRKLIFGIAGNGRKDLTYLVDHVETGDLRVVIDRCYPIEDTAEAHRYVEKGHKKGNVVITVGY
jgi:NADPH:quinone reductase-like Zn-dependent oxidoreductase